MAFRQGIGRISAGFIEFLLVSEVYTIVDLGHKGLHPKS